MTWYRKREPGERKIRRVALLGSEASQYSLLRPDGSFDLEAAAARQAEVEIACTQAQDYAAATGRLLKAMRCKLLSRRR